MAKKTTATTTDNSNLDRFGSRPGSQSAKINAAMTAKPQSIQQLAEKTKLSTSRVRNHMKWLVDRNHIEKTADGYKTVQAKRQRKATK